MTTLINNLSILLEKMCFFFCFFRQKNPSSPKINAISTSSNALKNKEDILNDIFDSQNENSEKKTSGENNADEDDDFNPRENAYAPIQTQSPNSNFGDFSSAFGVTNPSANKITKAPENSDEFADFTSAFNSGAKITNDNWSATPQAQISLMGSTIPNIGNPLANKTSNNSSLINPAQSAPSLATVPNSATDLLSTNLTMGSNLLNTMQTQGHNNQNVLRNNANNNSSKLFICFMQNSFSWDSIFGSVISTT